MFITVATVFDLLNVGRVHMYCVRHDDRRRLAAGRKMQPIPWLQLRQKASSSAHPFWLPVWVN
jgi:hypothetical protein